MHITVQHHVSCAGATALFRIEVDGKRRPRPRGVEAADRVPPGEILTAGTDVRAIGRDIALFNLAIRTRRDEILNGMGYLP